MGMNEEREIVADGWEEKEPRGAPVFLRFSVLIVLGSKMREEEDEEKRG